LGVLFFEGRSLFANESFKGNEFGFFGGDQIWFKFSNLPHPQTGLDLNYCSLLIYLPIGRLLF
jgi:hypothetical protein